jgi:hypothetical protein
MSIYKIYYEIHGKKLRVEIEAASAKEAMERVRAAIIFRKIERVPESCEVVDELRKIFGMFDEKR